MSVSVMKKPKSFTINIKIDIGERTGWTRQEYANIIRDNIYQDIHDLQVMEIARDERLNKISTRKLMNCINRARTLLPAGELIRGVDASKVKFAKDHTLVIGKVYYETDLAETILEIESKVVLDNWDNPIR